MAIPVLGGIWQLARRIENIFQDVAKLVHGLAALQADRGALGNERRKKIRWRGREITEDNASASC